MVTSHPNEKEKDRKLYFLVKFEWWPEEFGRHRASLSFQPDDMWEAALSWVAVSPFLKILCSTAGFGVEENVSMALLRRASGRVMTAHRGGSVMFGVLFPRLGGLSFSFFPVVNSHWPSWGFWRSSWRLSLSWAASRPGELLMVSTIVVLNPKLEWFAWRQHGKKLFLRVCSRGSELSLKRESTTVFCWTENAKSPLKRN